MASVTIDDRQQQRVRSSNNRQRSMQRWMFPREHGAYAALAFPVFTVLVAGRPTLEAWLLTFAAFAMFLAHEPLVVVLGVRGPRAERKRGATASRLLTSYGIVALCLGAGGLWLSEEPVHYAATVALVFALGGFMLSGEGLGRTSLGQAVIVTALALVALPVGLACGLSFPVSVYVVGVWALVGMLGASVVQLNVDRARRRAKTDPARTRWRTAAALGVSLVVVGAAFAAPFAGLLSLWVLAAASPTAIAAVWMISADPRPGRLRTIGWTLVGANVCTFLAVIGVLRLLAGPDEFSNSLVFPYF